MFTNNDSTNKAIEDIKKLGMEFTKYGIAVKDTMTMAADAAAMGLVGADLLSQVSAATKLAVLGQVTQAEALQTTISLPVTMRTAPTASASGWSVQNVPSPTITTTINTAVFDAISTVAGNCFYRTTTPTTFSAEL
jgi:hypothetical protein